MRRIEIEDKDWEEINKMKDEISNFERQSEVISYLFSIRRLHKARLEEERREREQK